MFCCVEACQSAGWHVRPLFTQMLRDPFAYLCSNMRDWIKSKADDKVLLNANINININVEKFWIDIFTSMKSQWVSWSGPLENDVKIEQKECHDGQFRQKYFFLPSFHDNEFHFSLPSFLVLSLLFCRHICNTILKKDWQQKQFQKLECDILDHNLYNDYVLKEYSKLPKLWKNIKEGCFRSCHII